MRTLVKPVSLLLILSMLLTACGSQSADTAKTTVPTLPPVTGSTPTPPPTTAATAAPGGKATLAPQSAAVSVVAHTDTGYTDKGEWSAGMEISPAAWTPGQRLSIKTTLTLAQSHLAGLEQGKNKPTEFLLLATAERTFDAEGWIRLPSDERMSTLLTPSGLPIEGGVQGAVTNRFGYAWKTPLDELVSVPVAQAKKNGQNLEIAFTVNATLPADLPPGIYRVRLDYGVKVGNNLLNLNGEAFARRAFPKGKACISHLFSPPFRASGTHASGKPVDAAAIRPRLPWVLLGEYNSNGYRGVIADEDRSRFNISGRNLIQDDVILPLYGDDGKPLTYSLEPQFPTDLIEASNNIPWDYAKGELSIQVTGPDGKTTDLGKAPFTGKKGVFPTTKKPAFTTWKPPAYGYYTVKMSGWISDIWGNRYEGGGTYHFWIARRMTLATATFQGMSYPVGNRYGRDLGFAPAVPADVEVEAFLYVNSDPNNVKKISYKGKASLGGTFGAAQGMQPLPFDAPGEYYAHILAKYTDSEGHLWVSTMRHAGVVYPADSAIEAHGKKVPLTGGKTADRGDTNFEGWVDTTKDEPHLAHINFPYNQGDVLLIASEQQGANKIEPVLTYDLKTNPAAYDPRLQTIGRTNLRLVTSNSYSPHLFPEYITEWGYYYAAAPRPGFMGRFLVAEDGTRAPYWPTSPNAFGGQINASSNGDLPGDIYRLIGGVVLRQPGKSPQYAGYLSSAFLLPKGTKNNRVIGPGSEDMLGPYGLKGRIFLVGTRPGMVYELGSAFIPAAQIDPVLPATITFTLTYPDGRQVTTQGAGDAYGSWAGKDRWTLDQAGVYSFKISGEWNGYQAVMPGLSASGGEFYVIEKEKPAGSAGLAFNLKEQTFFAADKGATFSGTSSAAQVHYAAVIPGSAVLQGSVPVKDGKFEFRFDPVAIAKSTGTYDIINLVNGKPEIRDVVHLTFFSEEKTVSGQIYHTYVRLILRGTTVWYVK